jgi:hypothetical protein
MNESDEPKRGTWAGAASESIALCANVDGYGVVLKCAGETIRNEIGDMGPNLEDMQLDKAPNGLSIWEGEYQWCGDLEDGYTESTGKFRSLTPEEWERLAKTGVPWEMGGQR